VKGTFGKMPKPREQTLPRRLQGTIQTMRYPALYFETIIEQIRKVEERSLEAIHQAVDRCVQCLQNRGVIHIYDTGHLVSRELINRAGGLVAFSPLTFDLTVNNPNPFREAQGLGAQTTPDTVRHIVSAALDRSRVQPNDVLIVGSVSGKTPFPVELAIQARERGVFVIALTALDYSSKLSSEHASGKRLFEVADLVIDNGAPYGDGLLTIEGLDVPFCPASGIGAAVVLWALVAGIVERMTEAGTPPTVLASINRPDGAERYKQSIEQYRTRGY